MNKLLNLKNIVSTIVLVLVGLLLIVYLLVKPKITENKIAVFVPGIIDNSPVYFMLTQGVKQAVAESNKNLQTNYKLDIIEAGTNQAEWNSKLTSLVATKKYDLIISSNPSIPDLAIPLTKQFPEQKFLILDAFCKDNSNIATAQFNQHEQSYLAGYVAGLVTTSSSKNMKFANSKKHIALIAAQEYPVMNNIILPGFIEGAKAVDSEIEVSFNIVGNWYDASKSQDIARSLIKEGVDVILPICGGANQGVISSAKELGCYLVWFDNNSFNLAPQNILACAVMEQQKLAYELTTKFLTNTLNFGSNELFGFEQGYINLLLDEALTNKTITPELYTKIINECNKVKSGNYLLTSN